jgi:hypothetical protein
MHGKGKGEEDGEASGVEKVEHERDEGERRRENGREEEKVWS